MNKVFHESCPKGQIMTVFQEWGIFCCSRPIWPLQGPLAAGVHCDCRAADFQELNITKLAVLTENQVFSQINCIPSFSGHWLSSRFLKTLIFLKLSSVLFDFMEERNLGGH